MELSVLPTLIIVRLKALAVHKNSEKACLELLKIILKLVAAHLPASKKFLQLKLGCGVYTVQCPREA